MEWLENLDIRRIIHHRLDLIELPLVRIRGPDRRRRKYLVHQCLADLDALRIVRKDPELFLDVAYVIFLSDYNEMVPLVTKLLENIIAYFINKVK